MSISRFHPLLVEHDGVVAWWVTDSHADTEHSVAVPYIEEPCNSRKEALEISDILNEENDQ